MRRMLRLLSRTGALAVPVPEEGGARVVAGRGSQHQVTLEVSGADWADAVRNAWVEPKSSGKFWTLSPMGRTQLRRLLSSGDASTGQSPGRSSKRSQRKDSRLRGQGRRASVDVRESPIAWLSRRRDKDGNPLLSQVQIDAAERLRADFWFAGMTPRVTTSWSACLTGGSHGNGGPGGDMELRDAVVAARERVRRAMSEVGPEFSGLLIDVCCHLKGLEAIERELGWPRRSGKLILGYALSTLARHYGLGPPAKDTQPSHAMIRHWGADGYRPSADAAEELSTSCGAGE